MDFNEDNKKNPTISPGVKVNIKHFFQIRYKDENTKNQMINLILKLVKEHEICDFLIEEKQAFNTTRIIYNYHTIISGNENLKYTILEEEFLKRQ